MRVAVITGPGQVELRDQPALVCGPEEVLVRVAACGLCTMERRLFTGDKRVYPVAAGHEVSGEVAAVGEAVAGVPGAPRVGDLVSVDLLTRCGSCHACRRGHSAVCQRPQGGAFDDGTVSMGAGLSEFVRVRAAQAFAVGGASPEHAAMGEPIACVVHSLRRAHFRAGDRLAIIGGGFMGRMHQALGRQGGAAEIGVVDVSAQRRDDAAAAGAHWTAAPDGVGEERRHAADVVVITAGAPGALELALDLVEVGGTVVLYGAFAKDATSAISPDAIHHHETSIVGAYSQEPEDWVTAAALLRSGVLVPDLDALVTARFGLEEVAAALHLAATSPVYRVLVGG